METVLTSIREVFVAVAPPFALLAVVIGMSVLRRGRAATFVRKCLPWILLLNALGVADQAVVAFQAAGGRITHQVWLPSLDALMFFILMFAWRPTAAGVFTTQSRER